MGRLIGDKIENKTDGSYADIAIYKWGRLEKLDSKRSLISFASPVWTLVNEIDVRVGICRWQASGKGNIVDKKRIVVAEENSEGGMTEPEYQDN